MYTYPIPWYVALLETVPETYFVIILGFKLFKLNISTKNALAISFANALLSYILRSIPLIFGIHTLIIILFLSWLCAWVLKVKIIYSMVSVLTGSLILGVMQNIFVLYVISYTPYRIQDFAVIPWLNILCFVPIGLLMYVVYLLVDRFNFIIFDLNILIEKNRGKNSDI